MKELKSKGPTLHTLVSEQRFADLAILLRDRRNTIHGAALRAHTVQAATADHAVIELSQELAERLWEAAERRDTARRWGLSRVREAGRLEPYSYATALVAETLAAIDQIADATDVELLLPPGQTAHNSRGERVPLIEPDEEDRVALLG